MGTATRPSYVLAIDLGTSACKVALVSTRGEVVAYDEDETAPILLPGGGAEQDPGHWWEVISRVSRRLMGTGVVAADEVEAVCATAQWSGTVAVDAGGHALRNAIIWMDTRGAKQATSLNEGLLNIEGYGVTKILRWIRITGGAPGKSGKDPITHILWLKDEEPETYRDTKVFLEPKDYLNLRMTGRSAASFDSIALHWVTDNRHPYDVKYHPGLLRLAGLEREKLPDLRPATDVLGPLTRTAAADLGVQEAIPVVVGTPDVQSAAIGSGATLDYQAHLYVGTSSWLTCHVPFKKTDLFHNIASLPSPIPGRYLIMDEQETAGGCLTFLRDRLFLPDDGLLPADCLAEASAKAYKSFDAMAASASPGAGGVLFTPWLYGERTPVENASIRGGFHHVSLTSSRSDLVRAVYEGVALNSRWLLNVVERFIHKPLGSIRFIGGGARSEIWAHIFADILDRRIDVVTDPVNANARGAGMLAAAALKSVTFEEMSDRIPVGASYEPEPENRALYEELFQDFVATYRRDRRPHQQMAGVVPVAHWRRVANRR
ncbi:MAG: FGGY-family carbohydrate kinase [Acidimicrobiales bacterium]